MFHPLIHVDVSARERDAAEQQERGRQAHRLRALKENPARH